MDMRWIWAGVLAAGLCGGMAAGQDQTVPAIQQARDASEPTLPLPRDKHGAVIEGGCDVALVVDATGKPQKIQVIHCTDKRLKDYAKASVAEYRFIPTNDHGQPVSAPTIIEISVDKTASAAVESRVGQNVAETFADGAVGGGGFLMTEEVHIVGGGVSAPMLIDRPLGPVAYWPKNFIGWPEIPKDGEGQPISVKVSAEVGVDGLVHEASILEPQYPDFEANALAAVKTYQFKPAMKYGKPVAAEITVIVTFTFYRRS